MTTTPEPTAHSYRYPARHDSIAAAITISGVFMIVGGTTLTRILDRTCLQTGIERDHIQALHFKRDLTHAEMLTVTDQTARNALAELETSAVLEHPTGNQRYRE